jgi:hypothetical protein
VLKKIQISLRDESKIRLEESRAAGAHEEMQQTNQKSQILWHNDTKTNIEKITCEMQALLTNAEADGKRCADEERIDNRVSQSLRESFVTQQTLFNFVKFIMAVLLLLCCCCCCCCCCCDD